MAAIEKRVGAMLVDVVQRDALLHVIPARGEFPQAVMGGPGGVVGLQPEGRVGLPLGEGQHLVRQPQRHFKLAAHLKVEPQPPGYGEKLGGLSHLPAELLGAAVNPFHLRRSIALDGHQCRAQREMQAKFLPGALGRLGQTLDELQSPGQVRDGFQVRRTLGGALSGPLPVTYGLLGETGLGEVMGQQFGFGLGEARGSGKCSGALPPCGPREPEPIGRIISPFWPRRMDTPAKPGKG